MNREWREAAAEHLEALCRQHKIMLNWRKRGFFKYEAHVEARLVYIGRPQTVKDYLGCLHEVGHIVSRASVAAHKKDQTLTCEAAAWEWAFDNAKPKLLGRMNERLRNEIGAAWATYLPNR